MRTFEIILTILLAIRIITSPWLSRRWNDALILLALGFMQIQIFGEGYRWQMIPLYAFTLGAALLALRGRATQKSEKSAPLGVAASLVGAIILLGAASLPPILLPVPTTPTPTGPYPVGTVSLHLTDSSRPEIYSDPAGRSRRFMIQIWYPAEPLPGSKPAVWMENMAVLGPAIARYIDLPGFFLDHVRYSQAHAYANAPLAGVEESYPLLLFSHGWNGFRAQNTFQAEELASHGYIVIAPDHAYGAVASVFPDGEVVLNNPMALPVDMGLPEAEFMAAARTLGEYWAGDLSFILNHLEAAAASGQADFLVDRINFERVAALGHSTGGGAAIEFCARDDRCRAVLGLDPYLDPVAAETLETGLTQPLLAMFSQVWHDREGDNAVQFAQLRGSSSGEVIEFWIAGTAHFDFTDLPAFSPLAPAIGLKGPINGPRALRIINDYSLAFFDAALKDTPSPLLDGPDPNYPEIFWNQD